MKLYGLFSFKFFYLCLISIYLFNLFSCKESSMQQEQNTSEIQIADSLELLDKFMIPTPKDAYRPKGLRKLSIIEMKELGMSPGFEINFTCKDVHGNEVAKDYYATGSEPRFMQIYVDSSGKPKEAVIYEMTDEIKSLMMLARLATY